MLVRATDKVFQMFSAVTYIILVYQLRLSFVFEILKNIGQGVLSVFL